MQIDIVNDGENVFLTGCAGTGKSATINEIIEQLRCKYGASFQDKVAVTGMTGMAATLVQGENSSDECDLEFAYL